MAHLSSIYVYCDKLTHAHRIIAKYLYLFASIVASWDRTVGGITRDQLEENIMAAIDAGHDRRMLRIVDSLSGRESRAGSGAGKCARDRGKFREGE
jgi:hypothetical protein